MCALCARRGLQTAPGSFELKTFLVDVPARGLHHAREDQTFDSCLTLRCSLCFKDAGHCNERFRHEYGVGTVPCAECMTKFEAFLFSDRCVAILSDLAFSNMHRVHCVVVKLEPRCPPPFISSAQCDSNLATLLSHGGRPFSRSCIRVWSERCTDCASCTFQWTNRRAIKTGIGWGITRNRTPGIHVPL